MGLVRSLVLRRDIFLPLGRPGSTVTPNTQTLVRDGSRHRTGPAHEGTYTYRTVCPVSTQVPSRPENTRSLHREVGLRPYYPPRRSAPETDVGLTPNTVRHPNLSSTTVSRQSPSRTTSELFLSLSCSLLNVQTEPVTVDRDLPSFLSMDPYTLLLQFNPMKEVPDTLQNPTPSPGPEEVPRSDHWCSPQIVLPTIRSLGGHRLLKEYQSDPTTKSRPPESPVRE